MAVLMSSFRVEELLANQSFWHYDDHKQAHRGTTVPQLTLFIAWMAALVIWVTRRVTELNLLPRLWSVPPEDAASTDLLPNGSPPSLASDCLLYTSDAADE